MTLFILNEGCWYTCTQAWLYYHNRTIYQWRFIRPTLFLHCTMLLHEIGTTAVNRLTSVMRVDKYIMRMTGKKFIIASARSENSLWLKCYCNQKSILLFLCISKLFVTKPLSDWRFLSLHFKKTPVYFDWNFPY